LITDGGGKLEAITYVLFGYVQVFGGVIIYSKVSKDQGDGYASALYAGLSIKYFGAYCNVRILRSGVYIYLSNRRLPRFTISF
jgi:hypothetical protein